MTYWIKATLNEKLFSSKVGSSFTWYLTKNDVNHYAMNTLLVLIVPFGSDLIRGLTTADFHPSWNFSVFSDRFIILVRVGMQCLRTLLSSFVGILSISHDLVGISIMNLYRLVSDIAVKLSSLVRNIFVIVW